MKFCGLNLILYISPMAELQRFDIAGESDENKLDRM